MTIRCIYTSLPSFPSTDQDPTAKRVQIGSLWVDYIGTTPTQADVDAILNPPTDVLDTSALNAALTAPGSVVRALGLIVFDMATGKIPVNPNYTMTQYVNLLKAKMR